MATIENKMDQYNRLMIRMAKESQTVFEKTREVLDHQDRYAALKMIEYDDRINMMEVTINQKAIEILTLMQPVAKDLRLLLAGIKIANDLERIADYAKNINRFVILENNLKEEYKNGLLSLIDTFLDNYSGIVETLENRSVKEAYLLAEYDQILDEKFKDFVSNLDRSKGDEEFPLEIVDIARYIERAGDHSKNIAEEIIYICNGQHLDFG